MAARIVPAGIVVGGLVVGVAAEVAAVDVARVGQWGPDLLTGLAFVGASAAAARRRGVALGLAAVAVTWFGGTVVPVLLHLHRGPLVHVLLAAPGRRLTRPGIVATAVGWAAALVPGAWRDDGVAAVLLAGLVAVAARDLGVARGRERADRRWTLVAIATFAAVVVGGALARRLLPAGESVLPALLAYDLTLGGLAVATARRVGRRSGGVVDLVVELGETPGGGLRAALARALADPSLQVGRWSPDGTYRDESGAIVAAPESAERAATYVEQAGRPLALLVHDAAVLDDPALVDAVATATRLAAAHDALTEEAREHSAELERSRRRLVVAGDEERRRLADRLHRAVERPLAALVADLRALPGDDAHVRQAAAHLVDSLDDLGRIAAGLHPRELDEGLGPAVAALGRRCPLPVAVDVATVAAVPPEVTLAAYYVVAEALSNAVKHAAATRISVVVRDTAAALTVEVVDDGRGGAQARPGSGLAGLRDRVEALGGTLRISGTEGTRVAAELPLDGHAM